VIHREACGNLASFRKQPEKWIPVAWGPPDPDSLFHVEIRADVTNRMGVLASVASAIARTQTNIDRVSVVERDTDTSTLIFELLHDRKRLASVICAVRASEIEMARQSRDQVAPGRTQPATAGSRLMRCDATLRLVASVGHTTHRRATRPMPQRCVQARR
jgi:hypothetical protein